MCRYVVVYFVWWFFFSVGIHIAIKDNGFMIARACHCVYGGAKGWV